MELQPGDAKADNFFLFQEMRELIISFLLTITFSGDARAEGEPGDFCGVLHLLCLAVGHCPCYWWDIVHVIGINNVHIHYLYKSLDIRY